MTAGTQPEYAERGFPSISERRAESEASVTAYNFQAGKFARIPRTPGKIRDKIRSASTRRGRQPRADSAPNSCARASGAIAGDVGGGLRCVRYRVHRNSGG